MTGHLWLVPPGSGGTEGAPDEHVELPSDLDADSGAVLRLLSRNLDYVGRPAEWLENVADRENVVIAVFHTDAIPELVNLMLREPQ